MDFGKIDLKAAAEEGAWMTVRHPVTNALTEARIKLLGRDSGPFRAVEDRQARARLEAIVSKQDALDSAIENVVERITAVTVAWEEFGWNGEPLECTPANAAKLYRERDWLLMQAVAFVENRANFYKG